MTVEERRLLVQESFARLKAGERREDIFDYLIAQGLEQTDVSQILLGSEDRLVRAMKIKAAETDISLPIVIFIAGLGLAYMGATILHAREGYYTISALTIVGLGGGAILILVGVITFVLKLRNKLTKKYD